MTQINSREDLEALRGSPGFEAAARLLYGSMTQWELVAGEWVAHEDLTSISRLGYTKPDFLAEILPFDFPAPQPPPAPAPKEPEMLPHLSARQIRLGLIGLGIDLTLVTAAIADIEDTAARQAAEVEWQYASQFERDHPLIALVSDALGLTAEQVDGAWEAASRL